MDRIAAFEQERSWLFSVAYRMLGSVGDAEDLVQETWLRWERVAADEIESPRAYLTTITTRLCIDHLRLARVRRETYVGTWLPEPVASDTPLPSARAELADSLSMAFLLLLERLSPAERAAYLLREVFGFSHDEVAKTLDKSAPACRQLLRRAKERIGAEQPRRAVDETRQAELLGAFLGAIQSADYGGLLAVLKEDVVLHADHGGKAVSVRRNIYGADRVARLFLGLAKKFPPQDATFEARMVNGRLGVIIHEAGVPTTAMHFEFAEAGIAAVYQVRNPDKLHRLPARG